MQAIKNVMKKNMYSIYLKLLEMVHGKSINVNMLHPEWLIRKYIKEFIYRNCNLSGGITVDLGCGTMPYKKYFISFTKQYFGFDHPIASNMVEGNKKPDVYCDALYLPIKNGVVKTIIFIETLEHLENPFKVLNEISKALCKNGILIMTVPFIYPIHGEPFDFYRYTKYSLKKLLNKNNFKIVSMKEHGNFISTTSLLFNNYLFYGNFNNSKLFKILKVIFTPILLLIMFITNLIGFISIKLMKNDNYVSNVFIIAEKME